MLTRQDSSLSSSRRQPSATPPPPPKSHHATGIGCMSGIFQLFSKYQSSTKRLTFGRKQEKRKSLSPKKGKCSAAKEERTGKELNSDVKSPRSPTLRPEIRRLHAKHSPEDSKTSPSLLMRLIGLDDFAATAASPSASEEDSITEKRKHLLQALEKCNEDLEALKRIINAVQKAEVRLQPPPPAQKYRSPSCDLNAVPLEVKPREEKCTRVVVEDPNIPSGTAAEVTQSPIGRFSAVLNPTAGGTIMPQACCKASTCTAAAAAEETTIEDYNNNDDDIEAEDNDDPPPITKLLMNKYSTEPPPVVVVRRRSAAGRSSSRAMVESVGEVCREIGWGEKREIGMIGLLVQDHLWTELIQDLLQDLNKLSTVGNNNNNNNNIKSMKHHPNSSPFLLPLQSCQRRLCF